MDGLVRERETLRLFAHVGQHPALFEGQQQRSELHGQPAPATPGLPNARLKLHGGVHIDDHVDVSQLVVDARPMHVVARVQTRYLGAFVVASVAKSR
jgi:hypothetical protein